MLDHELRAAVEQADEAAAWLDVVREAVSRMAVDAYVNPPGETELGILESVEGATDEAIYTRMVGRSPAAVLGGQG